MIKDPNLPVLKEAPKECWDDPAEMCKISQPNLINSTVLTSSLTSRYKSDMNPFFNFLPGSTLQPLKPLPVFNINDAKAWKRVNQQKKLKMFGDRDKDKVMNILDCAPYNSKKTGWLHNLGLAKPNVELVEREPQYVQTQDGQLEVYHDPEEIRRNIQAEQKRRVWEKISSSATKSIPSFSGVKQGAKSFWQDYGKATQSQTANTGSGFSEMLMGTSQKFDMFLGKEKKVTRQPSKTLLSVGGLKVSVKQPQEQKEKSASKKVQEMIGL